MTQYSVTGMSCAACSARVEKAVLAVPGVTQCSVSLLTNSMGVEGKASQKEIIAAVENAGYGAALMERQKRTLEDMLKNDTIPKLQKRLVCSLIFLGILMYFSMGHMMLGLPVGGFMEEHPVAIGAVQAVLALVIMGINKHFFVSGIKSLLHKAPNMDTLVALGSGAAFGYSLVSLLLMGLASLQQNQQKVMEYMGDFYFESAAMILTLITVGKLLEARSKGKTTDAIQSLLRLSPQKAVVLREGKEVEIATEEVVVGDIYVVRPGEQIPVDGLVMEGNSAVNEASLSGESIPVDKQREDMVYQGTINSSGFLKCRATKVGEDTTLSQIIRLVSDAAATKAPIAKVADKVSSVFVPVVIILSLCTFFIWLLCGAGVSFSLARGISVLVISCPCALGLATPVAIMVGNGVGAKNGIMFKTAVSLEETGKADIVVLDKTGTVTEGKPKVTDIYAKVEEERLLQIALSLEKNSEHPLAHAILEYCEKEEVTGLPVLDFNALPGNGLSGKIQGQGFFAGNQRFIKAHVVLTQQDIEVAERMAAKGQTPLYFAGEEGLLGIIAVADTMKEDSIHAIDEMKKLGLTVVLLTGDHVATARAIGEAAGVDHYVAGVLPEGKEAVIRKLKEHGKVVMVGDGINDAPALTSADMGIAIGAGADVAIEAADVVLMKNSLRDVAGAVRLSRATLRNIHQNLFWAFFYNCIGIPLAAGVFIPHFHLQLNPMFGAAAMSLSSFFVVSNALRLNMFQMYKQGKGMSRKLTKEQLEEVKKISGEAEGSFEKDKKIAGEIENDLKEPKKISGEAESIYEKNVMEEEPSITINKINQEKGEKKMTKTMKIEGMMCGHCEARVKKVLEALPQVSSAEVSHEKGTAIVNLSEELTDEALKQVVEAQDYKVISIE